MEQTVLAVEVSVPVEAREQASTSPQYLHSAKSPLVSSHCTVV